MNILITGGAGFIGSHLAERFLAEGHDVMVLDNFLTGRRDNLSPHARLHLREGDIGESGFVDKAFDSFRPEFVVHAAAAYKNPDDWDSDVRTNVLGSANIAQASQRHKIKRLVYFQTALCYGLNPKIQPVLVDARIDPGNSSYAITKTAGEQYILMSGVNSISFRLANIIGPRNMSGPIAAFYRRLVDNKPCSVKDSRRDFVYVKDLVDLVVLAMTGKGQAGIYHVSTGNDYAIMDLYKAVLKILGASPEKEVECQSRNPDDAFTILLDCSKTERDFNWRATTRLETSVRAAIDWYQSIGFKEAFTHLR